MAIKVNKYPFARFLIPTIRVRRDRWDGRSICLIFWKWNIDYQWGRED